MPIEAQREVTRLLGEIAAANDKEDTKRASDAKRALFGQVYDELKEMAKGQMKRERPYHSWGATGLVHEVYLRLMQTQRVFTKNRAYFFGAAARAMHRLLREHARSKNCRPEGHPDPQGHILLDEVAEEVEDTFRVVLLDLVNALEELKTPGEHGKRRYDVARLRIWSGMKYSDIAVDLGISVATVEREWQGARAWLHCRLKGGRTHD
jgi:RNA polymerase sigma factor (TIGR02999 family)